MYVIATHRDEQLQSKIQYILISIQTNEDLLPIQNCYTAKTTQCYTSFNILYIF